MMTNEKRRAEQLTRRHVPALDDLLPRAADCHHSGSISSRRRRWSAGSVPIRMCIEQSFRIASHLHSDWNQEVDTASLMASMRDARTGHGEEVRRLPQARLGRHGVAVEQRDHDDEQEARGEPAR
ncbi:hypothetical protein GCM10020218_066500 [Dactylosporangium vinaceum]